MPSSTAYVDRNGGASAVAVAARSETTESAVRTLYRSAKRASVATRRRVRRHDQSSTFAPRSRSRCPPGCQTLTARTRFYVHAHARASPPGRGPPPPATRPRSGLSAKRTCGRGLGKPGGFPSDRRGVSVSIPCRKSTERRRRSRRGLQSFRSCARLDGVRELALEQPVLVDVAVHGARLQQLLVHSARGDSSGVQDDDLVGERDRRQAVRDDQRDRKST